MIKKLIYILILIIICAVKTEYSASAQTHNAYLQYNGYRYFFKQGDEVKFLKNADKSMLLFENSSSDTEKKFYFQEAMRYYFLLSQVKPDSIDARIGLGRIYDEMKQDKFAKENFFAALNLNIKDARANYYFGNFYYTRHDFIEALLYFQKAYELGFSTNYELNYKMGVINEKLGDIEKAKSYYICALNINPLKTELNDKIRLLDDLNYSQSQYYLYRR